MYEKNLALFIHEVLYILYGDNPIIYDSFVDNMNAFIYFYRFEYRNYFSLLFDMDLVDRFFESNSELLSMSLIMTIIIKYSSDMQYAKLVEDVGRETDSKINDLALAYANYLKSLEELSRKKTTGQFKILH